MKSRWALVAIAVSALFAVGAVAPSIASAQNKCAGTKQKEAGKKANRKLKCWAKGIKKGLQADPNCLSKATFIFSSKWDKAEASQQPCTTNGDKNSMEAKVDAFVDDVVDELAGSPAGSILTTDAARSCAASKIKAAGKKAQSRLKCFGKATQKGIPVDPNCLAKVTSKFSSKWDKTEAKGGCATTNDKAAIESKVDAFVVDVVAELPGSGSTTTTTNTTTTGSSSTTSTSLPAGTCCSAAEIRTQSTGHCSNNTNVTCFDDSDCPGGSCVTDGVLQVATLTAFPFPLGVKATLEIAPADAFPSCKHDLIIPPGGFIVPVFCITGLNFSSQVIYTGCESGNADGKGILWDGASTTPDSDISKVADTSDGVCNPPGQICSTVPGGAGANSQGDIDTTRGNGSTDSAGVNLYMDLPATSLTWSAADASCPDSDGMYNPGTDTLVSQFDFILTPTTSTAKAAFVDKNADNCSFAGNGPQQTRVCSNNNQKPCGAASDCPGGTCGNGSLAGSPAAGPCCAVGQATQVAAAGAAFSGGAPLYDLLFASAIPTKITACGTWAGPADCTLTTDPCLGSPSGAFLDHTGLFE